MIIKSRRNGMNRALKNWNKKQLEEMTNFDKKTENS